MMKDDTSVIPRSGCNIMSSDVDTIINYNGNTRKTYKNIGGKWVFTYQQTSSNWYSYDGYQCLNVDNFSTYPQFQPIYEFINLILAVGLLYACFRLVIRPFLRSKI